MVSRGKFVLKKYYIYIYIIIIEFVLINILNGLSIKVESDIGHILGVLAFVIPVEMMLYNISKESTFVPKKRLCAKGVFWFVLVCTILGVVAKVCQ